MFPVELRFGAKTIGEPEEVEASWKVGIVGDEGFLGRDKLVDGGSGSVFLGRHG